MIPEHQTKTLVRDRIGNVLAAVGPLNSARAEGKGNLFGRLMGEQDVRTLIRRYDDEGPGIVGFYLDLKADMAGLCGYRIQFWSTTERRWIWADSTAATAILNDLRGPNGETTPDFVRMQTRELEAVGEVGLAEVPFGGGVRYRSVALDPGSYVVTQKDRDGNPLMLGFKGSKDAVAPKPGVNSTDWFEVPFANVTRIWRPHNRWFDQPYTPLMRSLRDVRRFDNAGRAVHRAVASQLVMAGMMWFEGDEKDLTGFVQGNANGAASTEQARRLGYLGQAIQKLMEYGERHLGDIDEEMMSAASPYPFVSKTPPQWVDMGRTLDPNLLDVKKDALEDFARDVNIPMSVLVDGQGAAQRLLNEWLQDKAFKQTAVLPDARRTAAGLTVAFLHTRLRALQNSQVGRELLSISGELAPVTNFRIWPDDSTITRDDPTITDITDAIKLGAIDTDALVEVLGMEEYRLNRPADVTGYEHWLAIQKSTSILDLDEPEEIEEAETAGIAATLNEDDDTETPDVISSWWTPPR